MINLIFSELTILRKDKITQVLALFLVLGTVVFTFLVAGLNLGSLAQQKREEIHHIQGSMDTVSELDRLDQTTSKKYANLLAQEGLISKQQMALIVELDEVYLKKEAELTELQLAASQDPLFADTLAYIPPLYALKQTAATNAYLTAHQLARAPTPLTGVNFTLALSSFLLLVVSLFVACFSSDILLQDQSHQSVVQGFPVSRHKSVWAKIITYTVLIDLLLCVGLLSGYFAMSWRFEAGPLAYPSGLYLFDEVKVLPFLPYLSLVFLVLPFVIIFTLLFSAVLNRLTQNRYLTLFSLFLCWLVPYFWPKLSHFTFWLPFDYLNLNRVLSGALAFHSQRPHLDLVMALAVLSGWSVLLSLSLTYLLKERKMT